VSAGGSGVEGSGLDGSGVVGSSGDGPSGHGSGPVGREVRIRAVLFDLDDTLMAHTRAVDEAIAVAQRSAGGAFAAADTAAVQRRWAELEEHHYTRYLTGELTYLGQRIARARDLLGPYSIDFTDEQALAWFDDYLVGYRDAWRLFDDVLPALAALRAARPELLFGIITNGDLAFQTDKLHRIALWDELDLTPVRVDGRVDEPRRAGRLIASGELGVTKPDPRIFHAAAAALGVESGACAYVGDRVRTDAVGAHAAGMLGIWLDRGDARNPVTDGAEGEPPAGVARIHSLSELPALVASLP
jgi:putative hydrolase of the HAD superfamily